MLVHILFRVGMCRNIAHQVVSRVHLAQNRKLAITFSRRVLFFGFVSFFIGDIDHGGRRSSMIGHPPISAN